MILWIIDYRFFTSFRMTVRSAGTRKAAALLAESAIKYRYIIDYKIVIPPPNAERVSKLTEYDAISVTTNALTGSKNTEFQPKYQGSQR